LDNAACLSTGLLKEFAKDHFDSSFGGETSANLMMKVTRLALKKPAR